MAEVILVKHYFVSPFLFNNKKIMFIYNKMINYFFISRITFPLNDMKSKK